MNTPLTEYMIPICTISEEIIKTTEKPEHIPPALQAIGLQREMLVHLNRSTNEQHTITPIIFEFVDQMLDTVFPLFLHPTRTVRKAAKQFLYQIQEDVLPGWVLFQFVFYYLLLLLFIFTFSLIRLIPCLKDSLIWLNPQSSQKRMLSF